MTDKQKAYALAVQLYQKLNTLKDTNPELETVIKLADNLAREMGWQWVKK